MVARATTAPGQGIAWGNERVRPVAVGLGVLLLCFLAAYFPSLAWMAGEWSSSAGALSHGYLVTVISAYLLVKAIPEVAALGLEPSWRLLLFVASLSAVWLLGSVATVVAVQTIVLPAILLLAIASFTGLRAVRPLAFPILYLYFAMPAWEHLQFIFQAITVAVVGVFIRLSGMPALLDGNLIQLAKGTFEIAGGCSGLAFIVAGLSVAALYGYLFYGRLIPTLLLGAVTLVVAMVGNWIRVFVIILIGYKTDMQSGLVDDHLTFGWVMFAFLMVPVYWFAKSLERPDSAESEVPSKNTGITNRISTGALIAALVAMVSGPAWAMTVRVGVATEGSVLLSLPLVEGRWAGPSETNWNWQPIFNGPDAERIEQYGQGSDFVLAYVNVYLSQEQDRELVYMHNNIAGNWRLQRAEQDDEVVAIGRNEEFRQRVVRDYSSDWLIWFRYQVGNQFEATDVRAKITQALETLKGRPVSGVIAFATTCDEDCEDAVARLSAFVQDVGGSVEVDYTLEEK